ncbi:hypothetical protein NECAME_18247, partial [Necator americanus]
NPMDLMKSTKKLCDVLFLLLVFFPFPITDKIKHFYIQILVANMGAILKAHQDKLWIVVSRSVTRVR